jgi:RNA polymerase sigma-70 factor (ECF subfamily)
MPAQSDEGELIERLQSGDRSAASDQFAAHRQRLKRMVALRMDRRLNGRIDASDVVQEAYLDAARRLDEYLQDPVIPFFLWLRLLTIQKLAELHRRHLGTKARDAGREISLYAGPVPQAESRILAEKLVGRLSSPSSRAMRDERKLRLQEALDQLDPLDQEVIALRHFERLSNKEVAQVMELSISGASSRYVRAMLKLKQLLAKYAEYEEGPL